jgi:hypothetical protein
MRPAPPAGAGFFPLDDELGLLPGGLSASLAEGVTRLSAWMPFAQAAEQIAFFWRVRLSDTTVRRQAEAAGAAYVEIQTTEVERLEREAPEPPAGPAVQQVSADGAMVSLVGGTWAEVRTVALGTVTTDAEASGAEVGPAHATDRSYFSRMTDAASFIRLAHPELHRRGTETAGVVVGVNDGADWEQRLLDRYRPDAVRVLDFPHGLEHVAAAAQATFGSGTEAASAWLAAQADALKHGAPSAVLVALLELPTASASSPSGAAAVRDGCFSYLAKRLDQLRYADFVALGYPIGSGLVESANKLVVEARLKGSGMHWAPAHVNPMLALRNIACSDRWFEAWPQICGHLRAEARARRAARSQQRRARRTVDPLLPPQPAQRSTPPARPKRVIDGRPTTAHPWKRRFLTPRTAQAAS